jgi:nucleoporin POM152
MVLHGTPPFKVHYRTQRDQEPSREEIKNVFGSRGELDLKPDRSGHYSYTFVALSDANYKKVPLNGPSIEQSVHPLASVDFRHREHGGGRKQINSCAGSIVDVDIDLKVCHGSESSKSGEHSVDQVSGQRTLEY